MSAFFLRTYEVVHTVGGRDTKEYAINEVLKPMLADGRNPKPLLLKLDVERVGNNYRATAVYLDPDKAPYRVVVLLLGLLAGGTLEGGHVVYRIDEAMNLQSSTKGEAPVYDTYVTFNTIMGMLRTAGVTTHDQATYEAMLADLASDGRDQ